MKVLIVYASWFGHNRAIAEALADELTRLGADVDCAKADDVAPQDLAGYDLLVLGTYTHAGAANRQLRTLCETIPHPLFDRLEIALFGTQTAEDGHPGGTSGVDELEACLLGRGCELALAPLRFELSADQAMFSWKGLGPADRRRIKEFAADVWEASVPAPLV
jgi:flavodoxin